MEGAVHAVDHQRLILARNIEHAFDAQQPISPRRAYGHQPPVEPVPVERLLEGKAK
jgi:hypothetical protein